MQEVNLLPLIPLLPHLHSSSALSPIGGGGGKPSLDGDKLGGAGGKSSVDASVCGCSGETAGVSTGGVTSGFLKGGCVTGRGLLPPNFKLGLVPCFLPPFGVNFNFGFPIGGRVIPGGGGIIRILIRRIWICHKGIKF